MRASTSGSRSRGPAIGRTASAAAILRAVALALGCGAAHGQPQPAPGTLPTLILPDGGRYHGALAGGLLEGPGRIVWNEVRHFEGSFHRGLMQGPGKLTIPSGVYEGEFRNGELNGPGTYQENNGPRYEGRFANSEFDGQGRLSYANGLRYEGQFSKGKFTGQGTMTDTSGLVVSGRFLNYEPDGVMQARHPSGLVYVGRLKNSQPEGQGEMRLPDGKIVKGDFSQAMQERTEILYPNGNRYVGETAFYTAQGQGVLTYASGDVYTGRFARDLPDGPGRLAPAQNSTRPAQQGLWSRGKFLRAASADDLAARDGGPAQAARNNQAALYAQNALLARQMAALKPNDPDKVEMYALFVAGDGTQEVFRREVEYVAKEFERRFDTGGRSMLLANSRSSVERLPLATDTSLERALGALAQRMDKERDLLFVFLTSHGSSDHQLQIGMRGLSLPQLSAKRLGQLLKASGIRKQIVVVSACYSGGFIAPLAGPTTWVITAARADRTSFGCADENDFTYFGRALFKESLPRAAGLGSAFDHARQLVAQWEKTGTDQTGEAGTLAAPPKDDKNQPGGDAQHSEPQMSVTAAFQNEVDAWIAAHPAVGP